MTPENFCAFILTHGRPDRVYTYQSLRRHGYTGKIYLIIDNEDETSEEYYKRYTDEIIMFDKKAIAETFDEGDNFEDRRAVVYARNACFQIAQKLGFAYFIQLDDDYTDFRYKQGKEGDVINKSGIVNLDNIFVFLLKYYKSIPVLSLAMSQGGDFLGGKDGNAVKHPQFRKCMNTLICSTKRFFQFIGRINEDVNTYVYLGSCGKLFLTIPLVAINQKTSQHNPGGMSELYLDSGTYIKSFYTVMYHPSSVHIQLMQSRHHRLHHHVSWCHAVPVILDEKYKK